MGRHGDETRQRGIAGWLIASTVGAVVVVALAVTYFVFLNSDSGSGAVDTSCTGSTRIEIVAGTSSPAIQAAADAFNTTGPEARGSCLIAHVSTIASGQVADSLIAGWTGQANPEPTIWIPDNPADLAEVAASTPGLVAGYNDTEVADSPVVLATTATTTTTATGAAAGFGWADLLRGAVTLPDGTPVTLALGDPRTDRATGYALESMVAGTSTAAVTPAAVGAAAAPLTALTRSSVQSDSGQDLLSALGSGGASFNAVPVLESTLAQYNRRTGGTLRALYPSGPTAGDRLTGIALAADWVDVTESEGAARFLDFLSSPAGGTALADSGERVPGATAPTAGNGVDPAQPVTALPAAGSDVLVALADAMGLESANPTAAPSGSTTVPPTADATPTGSTSTAATVSESPAPDTAQTTANPGAVTTP